MLLKWAVGWEMQGLFHEASIGKGAFKNQQSQVRSDQIAWIDPEDQPYYKIVDDLFGGLLELARSQLFLPVKRFECHFAKYEEGNLYQRHKDRHKHNPSRLLTAVLYLSSLLPDEGGTLVLYHGNGESSKIHPQQGTLVVFDSGLEHEVELAKKNRWSLTGWLRDDIHPGLII
ncbi:MAG: 2OG-Fe(II) oxygenase [Bdellovibrionales bacterium]|nr:2OG-Fe(II) oxygenase [Bdellovibrionales bacterium]